MKGQKIEIQKAIELGKALAESSQLLRLRKAQAELLLDKEAEKYGCARTFFNRLWYNGFIPYL